MKSTEPSMHCVLQVAFRPTHSYSHMMGGMRKDPAELLKVALALPPEGRAALADSLLESLDHEVDEGAEQAWLDEIQKRLHEIDTGAIAMIPWEEAERRLWAKAPSK